MARKLDNPYELEHEGLLRRYLWSPVADVDRQGIAAAPAGFTFGQSQLAKAQGSAVRLVGTGPNPSSKGHPPARAANNQQETTAPQRHRVWIEGRQPGDIDPSRTEVFQPGPDGKLHPIPGWRTTGPLDFAEWSRMFDWDGVRGDLSGITSGALSFLGGGGVATQAVKRSGYKIGPDVVRGRIENHHAEPKFLGGLDDQELAPLHASIHRMYHADLVAALKKAGFGRVGGRGGGAKEWAEYLRLNPAKKKEVDELLRKVTREFDKKNAAWLSRYLDRAVAKRKGLPPPPK